MIDTISGLVRELREAAVLDRRLERRADALESSLIDIEDTAGELRRYQDGIDLDEGSLARMQERMSQLQGLLHSYGPRMQEVFERRQRAAELVDSARNGTEHVRAAAEALAAAESRLEAAADNLDRARGEAAPRQDP